MSNEQVMTAFLFDPRNWAYGVGALVVLAFLFGRQRRYDAIDETIAHHHGVTLPKGSDKDIGPIDSLNIVSFFGMIFAFMAGLMLDPFFFGIAAVLLALFALSMVRAWSTAQSRLRRAGVAAPGGAAGGFCSVMTFVLIAAGCVIVVFVVMGLLV